jgi:hypothetical protein
MTRCSVREYAAARELLAAAGAEEDEKRVDQWLNRLAASYGG